jgi:hypothetical protein
MVEATKEERNMPSILIKDLYTVPGIVSDLGLGIAAAQKQFNLGYLEAIQVLVAQIKELLGGDPAPDEAKAKLLSELLMNLAPPRLQFTETEIKVQMDLSQSTDAAGQVGLGFGLGALVVNAAFAFGFSQDYRAAAEVRSVIHAALPTGENKQLFNQLLQRAKEIDASATTLPALGATDQKIVDLTKGIAGKLGKADGA